MVGSSNSRFPIKLLRQMSTQKDGLDVFIEIFNVISNKAIANNVINNMNYGCTRNSTEETVFPCGTVTKHGTRPTTVSNFVLDSRSC